MSRSEAYRELGLRPGAKISDVREAYVQAVLRHHPDKAGGGGGGGVSSAGSTNKYMKAVRAYETIREHHHAAGVRGRAAGGRRGRR